MKPAMLTKSLTLLSLLIGLTAINQGCGSESAVAPVSDDAGTVPVPSATAKADSGDPGQQDAGEKGVPDAGSDSGGTCNAVVQQGASFEILATQAAAPAPQGGTIADGTWLGTSAKIWGSSSPEGTKVGTGALSTWEVTGTTIQVISTGASSGKVTRRTLTLSTVGTTFTLSEACANPLSDGGLEPAQTGGYTATATTMSFFSQGSGSATLEFVFTKK